jgi:hypothetical protein
VLTGEQRLLFEETVDADLAAIESVSKARRLPGTQGIQQPDVTVQAAIRPVITSKAKTSTLPNASSGFLLV